jgi:hypothetical protein
MSDKKEDLLRIHVNVLISASSLQAIVANAKKMAVQEPNGIYRVDTAEKVSEMITRFLAEKDFDSFVKDINNYEPAPGARIQDNDTHP